MTGLAAAAMAYRDRPWRHLGRGPTHFDCVGLVRQARLDVGLQVVDVPANYGREPDGIRFYQLLVQQFGEPVLMAPVLARHIEAGALQVDDVLAMRTARHPHHLAIVAPHPDHPLGLIHACGREGRVVWQALDRPMLRSIAYVFRGGGAHA